MRLSSTALRLTAAAVTLLLLWILGAELPLLRWISLGAGRLRGSGVAGALLWGAGMYVATLRTSPFMEMPLGKGRESKSSGVVIGLMKQESGDAR